MQIRVTIGLLFALTICACGQGIPKGYTLPNTTRSPDRCYGVTVPIADQLLDSDKGKDATNSLVETKSGRVLTIMQGEAGWDRALNFLELVPSRWSSDGSLLLWKVDRKWSPAALDLLKINGDKVEWQVDILHDVQQALLIRTKKEAPQKYASAKKANAGSFDPALDGFIIDVKAVGPMKVPLHVEAVLTSDPKTYGGDDTPLDDRFRHQLDSYLDGIVDVNGKFTVTSFHMGTRQWDRF